MIEPCSPGLYLEMFVRGDRPGWSVWGNQATSAYAPDWPTYAHHSQRELQERVEDADLFTEP